MTFYIRDFWKDAEFNQHKLLRKRRCKSNSMVSRRSGELAILRPGFKEITGLSMKPTTSLQKHLKKWTKKMGGSPRLDPNLVSWFWWAEMLRKLQNLTFVLADHSGVVAWYPIGVCSAVTWDIESRIRICGEWWICSFHFISIQFSHSFLVASFYEFQFFSG